MNKTNSKKKKSIAYMVMTLLLLSATLVTVFISQNNNIFADEASDYHLQQEKLQSEETKKALRGKIMRIYAEANEAGKMRSSVTEREVSDAIKELYGIYVDKRSLYFDRDMKDFGLYKVKADLPHNVTVFLFLELYSGKPEDSRYEDRTDYYDEYKESIADMYLQILEKRKMRMYIPPDTERYGKGASGIQVDNGQIADAINAVYNVDIDQSAIFLPQGIGGYGFYFVKVKLSENKTATMIAEISGDADTDPVDVPYLISSSDDYQYWSNQNAINCKNIKFYVKSDRFGIDDPNKVKLATAIKKQFNIKCFPLANIGVRLENLGHNCIEVRLTGDVKAYMDVELIKQPEEFIDPIAENKYSAANRTASAVADRGGKETGAGQRIIDSANKDLQSIIDTLAGNLAGMYIKPDPALLNGVKVNYYGSTVPINEIASITVESATVLVIDPYDISILGSIEEAVRASGIDITPENDGKRIKLRFPQLTGELREQLLQEISNHGEQAKNKIRSLRKAKLDELKNMFSAGAITQEEKNETENELQGVIDDYHSKVDAALKAKRQEV